MNMPEALKNKRIAYYIHSLKVSGAETIVTNYLIRLKQAGADVILIQWQQVDSFLLDRVREAGIEVYSCCRGTGKGKIKTFLGVRRLKSILKKTCPDVIHVHTGLEKFKLIKWNVSRLIFTLHSGLSRSLSQGKNHREMFLKLAGEGMEIIALTEGAKQDILEKVPDARVTVIPNGFELNDIRARGIDINQAKQRLGIDENTFVMGHVGRFHPVKNHEKLLDVFSQVVALKGDARLLLVGARDEKRLEELRGRVSKDVWEKIIFLGETREVEKAVSAMDAFVFPSINEAFPLTAIEAQVLGKKVYISDGVPEAIQCSKDCHRLKLGDSDRLWAEVILGLAKEQQPVCGQKHSIEDYDIGTVIQRHMEIYGSHCQ